MLENVRYSANLNNVNDETRIKSSEFAAPSFKANPNAVDTTPAADTYSVQVNAEPEEMSFGQKLIRYILPTGLALNFSTQLFNNANKGEYEKSLLGRLGKLGDRLSETKLVRNRFVDSARIHGSAMKRNLQNYVDRSEVLSAMQKTPTKPECTLVTNFLETQAEADIKEAANKLTKFIESDPKSLKEAGATKAEIKAFKAKYGTDLFGRIKNPQAAIREYQLCKMFPNPEAVPANIPLKELRLQYLNLNEAEVALIKKHPEKYARLIEQSLTEAKDVSPKLNSFLNKILSNSLPKTKLGRLFPKMAKLGMRGLTFGGGFFNSLFIGFFVADAVKNTVDAPKEQKLSTGIHGLFEAVSWVIAMPIALKAMHAVNGLKNLGKTKTQVDAYTTAFKNFEEMAKNRAFSSKAEYDTAWQAVENLKNAGTKPKGFKKFLSGLGKFLSIGLEQKPTYKVPTEKFGFSADALKNWASKENMSKIFGNLKRMSKQMPKNLLGYPLRFALYMFAFQPVVDKLFTTPIKAIFGKPYDPEKIKEEKEKEEQRLAEIHANRIPSIPEMYGAQDSNAVAGLQNVNENDLSDDNLIKKTLKEKNALPPEDKKPAQQNPSTTQETVNGVQINTVTNGKPYMPQDQQLNNGQVSGQQTTYNGQKDPNISDYDTVKRDYIPTIDGYDVKYGDPFYDPNNSEGINKFNNMYTKMDKAELDVYNFIKNGYENKY